MLFIGVKQSAAQQAIIPNLVQSAANGASAGVGGIDGWMDRCMCVRAPLGWKNAAV